MSWCPALRRLRWGGNDSEPGDVQGQQHEPPEGGKPTWRFRLVAAGVVLGLTYKWRYFRFSDWAYHRLTIRDEFFPTWLQDADVLRWVYVAAVLGWIVAGLSPETRLRQIASVMGLMAGTVLMMHRGSYNDMTFVTAWWAGVWLTWMAFRLPVDPADVLDRKAARLAATILSVTMLGAVAGKWTNSYWSGDVLREIYFVDRDHWLFNWIRHTVDAEHIPMVAKWYSRMVIATETIAGLTLWWMPRRLTAVAGATLFASIAIFSNVYLISVVAPLVALAVICWPSGTQG